MSKISRNAKVSSKSKLGENVVIMDNVVISSGTKIGNNTVIYPDTYIGKNVLILDNCVLGRRPFNLPNLDRKPSTRLKGLKIGNRCQIGANVVLYKGSTIGNQVMICDFSSIREGCDVGDNVVLGKGVYVNYNVKIGNNARIMDGCHFGGDMVIEKDVFMGPFVCSANDNYMGMGKKSARRKGAHIKRGARIGLGCILLANITIGEYAVIGAGALVDKDIESNYLAYGFPVRVVRKLK